METPADANIVKHIEQLTGTKAQAIAFGTEAPYLQQLGMDVVVMGPGKIDVAHQPNEYLDSRQITPTIELLRKLIQQHCVTS